MEYANRNEHPGQQKRRDAVYLKIAHTNNQYFNGNKKRKGEIKLKIYAFHETDSKKKFVAINIFVYVVEFAGVLVKSKY